MEQTDHLAKALTYCDFASNKLMRHLGLEPIIHSS